jgi:acetyl esterase
MDAVPTITSPASDKLDPAISKAGAVLQRLGLTSGAPELTSLSEARRSADALGDFFSEAQPPVPGEHEIVLAGPYGALPCRVFPGIPRAPALVYFHGGGFALGRAKGWDGLMRRVVRTCGITTINVDYRRSPEYRFPVAFEEAVFTLEFIHAHGGTLGVDPNRVATGGDSAGANLALAAACALRDRGTTGVAMLLLFYGMYSMNMKSASWQRLGYGTTGLTQKTMSWIWQNYLSDDDERTNWRAAPLSASLEGLPYTYLSVGTMDPLLDDNCQLGERLAAAGVEHYLRIWPGLNHGFVRLDDLAPTAARALDEALVALRIGLGSHS